MLKIWVSCLIELLCYSQFICSVNHFQANTAFLPVVGIHVTTVMFFTFLKMGSDMLCMFVFFCFLIDGLLTAMQQVFGKKKVMVIYRGGQRSILLEGFDSTLVKMAMAFVIGAYGFRKQTGRRVCTSGVWSFSKDN